MRWLLLFYTIILTNHASPVEDNREEVESVAELHRQFKLVTYVENFKHILSEYVKKAYNNLTINETEKIKTILENFFKNFTNNLRDILNGNKVENIDYNEKIEDGIPDDNFDAIKQKVKMEFVDVNDETVDRIVFALRNELFKTRQSLDQVIEESKIALKANSD